MDRRRWRQRRQRVSAAVSMATKHMRDRVTWAIRRWAYHGGGFSCWHTRAVSWAVSAAFTFLPKIEGYGGGSRPFFLCLSSLSPSSFSTLFLLSFYQLFYFLLSFYFLSISLSPLVFIFFAFSFNRFRAVLYFSELVLSLNLFFGERYGTRVSETCETVVIWLHPS